MNVQQEVHNYISTLPESKRGEMQELHTLILEALPGCKLWFDNGQNADGKTVSNPSIGYGQYTIKYADGKTRDFYQIGLSVNTTGISVYVMGIKDKTYLAKTFSADLGKASVTGYCIKFKSLKDINSDVLIEAIQYGVKTSGDI